MSYETGLMVEVAKLYYKDNLTQESVGRRLNISKYKVNRVLKKALADGIVQIYLVRVEGKKERLK